MTQHPLPLKCICLLCFLLIPLSTSCSIIFIPSPSMSIPSFDTKCARFLKIFALHSIPIQRAIASPSSLTTGEPQTGHYFLAL